MAVDILEIAILSNQIQIGFYDFSVILDETKDVVCNLRLELFKQSIQKLVHSFSFLVLIQECKVTNTFLHHPNQIRRNNPHFRGNFPRS
jgi:hypothetical protein